MRLIALSFILFSHMVSFAYDPEEINVKNETPKELKGLSLEQNLGDQIDLSLSFVDDNGNPVTLGQYFDNNRPVIMGMVYYNCPSLCNFQLNGWVEAFKKLEWKAGVDYTVLAVSMNPKEDASIAGPKKANYIDEYGHPETSAGWHFLTGKEENIQTLAKQLGFKYNYLPEKQEYSHAAVSYVLTPGGQISRYLSGISFLPGTLKMALLEASNGKIGSIVEQILMFCFQFDPQKSKYTLYSWRVMQIGATLTVILLAIFLIPVWIRERKKKSVVKGDS